MSGVQMIEVGADEAGQRLDRWFRGRFPGLTQGKLQKLMRTGQIRVDGGRVKASDRVDAGQVVRVPPGVEEAAAKPAPARTQRLDLDEAAALADELKHRVLYMDDDVLAIDKPAGLAVQGGSKTDRHVDAVLDRLKFGAKDRPRLVHRLDRDTSGVLVLARSRMAAKALGDVFKDRDAGKIYWAVTEGVPTPRQGLIDAPLSKGHGPGGGELMRVDELQGKSAKTGFRVIDAAGDRAALLELQPLTGRTHQIRVHCAAIGTPILGDPKYGPRTSPFYDLGVPRKLHLHARSLDLDLPGRRTIHVEAPPPPHMLETFGLLGIDPGNDQDR